MSRGFFGNLFDLNHDGELDARERFLDYVVFDEMCTNEACEKREDDNFVPELVLCQDLAQVKMRYSSN